MRTLQYELDVNDNRMITIKLPDDILPGKHQIIIVVDAPHPVQPDGDDHFRRLLNKTSGIWTKGDGLKYQTGIRDEWKNIR